jgi:hypothetical protein
VLATVLDAVDIGFRVIVVRDAVCSSSDEGLACCRFRGHREKVIAEAGGGPWEGECLRENLRLRRSD